ncbi:hypothetical protein J2D73_19515 [Acetobacter sacchari]|uniref:Uncharacterized protein n=1 Tax=Acetobacter sacchari TaxID=2661687 RepID=A0ABS3M1C0_9PROT|nr:hypothetical protein [Acetobacter sacchari]MBO1361974.1 hypothetical protein [Acetobacter sacchari]
MDENLWPTFGPYGDIRTQESKTEDESVKAILSSEWRRKCFSLIEWGITLLHLSIVDWEIDNEYDRVKQMLGLRMLNSSLSSVSLILQGYSQPALSMVRDIMETGNLLEYFRLFPDEVVTWARSNSEIRRKKYSAQKVRNKTKEKHQDVGEGLSLAYWTLCDVAVHPTPAGFNMLLDTDSPTAGPQFVERHLNAWLREMILRFSPAVWIMLLQVPHLTHEQEMSAHDYGTAMLRVAALPLPN